MFWFMFVQPALYPVDFSVLPPSPTGRKKKKGKVMEMEKQHQHQQQQQQHLKNHSNNNNEQCNKNNENRPEKEMTIMVRILTTTTDDDEDKKKTKKEKEKEREWPLWTLKWFTHQHRHRHRTPPATQAIVCYVPPPHPPRQQKFHDCNPSITYADILNLTPSFRKIAAFLNLLDHMILWSLWFRFLLGRRRRRRRRCRGERALGWCWILGRWRRRGGGMEGWRDDWMMRWELMLCNEW